MNLTHLFSGVASSIGRVTNIITLITLAACGGAIIEDSGGFIVPPCHSGGGFLDPMAYTMAAGQQAPPIIIEAGATVSVFADGQKLVGEEIIRAFSPMRRPEAGYRYALTSACGVDHKIDVTMPNEELCIGSGIYIANGRPGGDLYGPAIVMHSGGGLTILGGEMNYPLWPGQFVQFVLAPIQEWEAERVLKGGESPSHHNFTVPASCGESTDLTAHQREMEAIRGSLSDPNACYVGTDYSSRSDATAVNDGNPVQGWGIHVRGPQSVRVWIDDAEPATLFAADSFDPAGSTVEPGWYIRHVHGTEELWGGGYLTCGRATKIALDGSALTSNRLVHIGNEVPPDRTGVPFSYWAGADGEEFLGWGFGTSVALGPDRPGIVVHVRFVNADVLGRAIEATLDPGWTTPAEAEEAEEGGAQ